MNPYYSPDKLGLEMICFDEPDLCYEYNTLCYWATKDGRIYSASDSGCSCPTPFEAHDKDTTEDVLETLERVGSIEHAKAIFDSWNKGIKEEFSLSNSERQRMSEWVKARLVQ